MKESSVERIISGVSQIWSEHFEYAPVTLLFDSESILPAGVWEGIHHVAQAYHSPMSTFPRARIDPDLLISRFSVREGEVPQAHPRPHRFECVIIGSVGANQVFLDQYLALLANQAVVINFTTHDYVEDIPPTATQYRLCDKG